MSCERIRLTAFNLDGTRGRTRCRQRCPAQYTIVEFPARRPFTLSDNDPSRIAWQRIHRCTWRLCDARPVDMGNGCGSHGADLYR